MSDRELLELAAKAAGYELKGFDVMRALVVNEHGHTIGWNPLTDDGDALRLAVKLRICVEFTYCTDDAPVLYAGQVEDRRDWQMQENFPDPYATIRRAIVRAAAAIGGA